MHGGGRILLSDTCGVSEQSADLPGFRESTGSSNVDLHSAQITGHQGRPLGQHSELLDEKYFWMGHLCSWGAQAGGLLFGPGYSWAEHRTFQQRLWHWAVRPTFTIPLTSGHRLHIAYRGGRDEARVEYLVHNPEWERDVMVARDDGHFMGPGLSWPNLLAATENGLSGGTTTDPHTRLLLLLPAFGDAGTPQDGLERLAAALRARLGSPDAESLAAAMIDTQGLTGPVRWTTTGDGVEINDGEYSLRNPTSSFALTGDHLIRASAALAA